MDNSVPHIDPECMKVMFPSTVAEQMMHEITWPKNPGGKRYGDQIVRETVWVKKFGMYQLTWQFFSKITDVKQLCH